MATAWAAVDCTSAHALANNTCNVPYYAPECECTIADYYGAEYRVGYRIGFAAFTLPLLLCALWRNCTLYTRATPPLQLIVLRMVAVGSLLLVAQTVDPLGYSSMALRKASHIIGDVVTALIFCGVVIIVAFNIAVARMRLSRTLFSRPLWIRAITAGFFAVAFVVTMSFLRVFVDWDLFSGILYIGLGTFIVALFAALNYFGWTVVRKSDAALGAMGDGSEADRVAIRAARRKLTKLRLLILTSDVAMAATIPYVSYRAVYELTHSTAHQVPTPHLIWFDSVAPILQAAVMWVDLFLYWSGPTRKSYLPASAVAEGGLEEALSPGRYGADGVRISHGTHQTRSILSGTTARHDRASSFDSTADSVLHAAIEDAKHWYAPLPGSRSTPRDVAGGDEAEPEPEGREEDALYGSSLGYGLRSLSGLSVLSAVSSSGAGADTSTRSTRSGDSGPVDGLPRHPQLAAGQAPSASQLSQASLASATAASARAAGRSMSAVSAGSSAMEPNGSARLGVSRAAEERLSVELMEPYR